MVLALNIQNVKLCACSQQIQRTIYNFMNIESRRMRRQKLAGRRVEEVARILVRFRAELTWKVNMNSNKAERRKLNTAGQSAFQPTGSPRQLLSSL